jgi:hypothetical protein
VTDDTVLLGSPVGRELLEEDSEILVRLHRRQQILGSLTLLGSRLVLPSLHLLDALLLVLGDLLLSVDLLLNRVEIFEQRIAKGEDVMAALTSRLALEGGVLVFVGREDDMASCHVVDSLAAPTAR